MERELARWRFHECKSTSSHQSLLVVSLRGGVGLVDMELCVGHVVVAGVCLVQRRVDAVEGMARSGHAGADTQM